MTEPRKVALKSVGHSVTSSKTKDRKEDNILKTRRFNLSLTESNDDTFPEYSYMDLCSIDDTKTLTDSHAASEYDPDDPFALGDRAAHDKLVSLAKKYEEKYTPKSGKRKRKDRVRDLVDLGDGYDEEDSFVDNSEAYDEYMPCSVSTKYGGFYINAGHLDIVPVDDESNEDVTPCRKKARKINSLTDSEESSSSNDEPRHKASIKKRNGKDLTGFNVVKKRIKKSFAPTKVVKKAAVVVKRLNGLENLVSPNVPVVAQPAQKPLPVGTVQPLPVGTQPLPTVVQPLAIVANNCSQLQPSGPLPNNQLPTDAEKLFACTVRLSRSNSAVQVERADNPDPSDGILMRTVKLAANDAVLTVNDSPLCRNDTLVSKDQLNITTNLREFIVKIEKAAKASGDGKIKQFTPELNETLLQIDNLTRSASNDVRSHLMTRLGTHFACGKDGLIKRALKRNLTENDVKMKEATTKLKEAIRVELSPHLEKYNFAKTLRAENEKGNESEDDASRKLFIWTDAVRRCLCRVVKIRLERYEISKLRGEAARSYVESFLDSSIKPLWEAGTVRTADLMRESRSAHAHLSEPSKAIKSKSVAFIPTTPTTSNTVSKIESKNVRLSKTSSPDDSPVMIDVREEQSRSEEQTHSKVTATSTSKLECSLLNKTPQSRSSPSTSNGDLGRSNKVEHIGAQDKSTDKPAAPLATPAIIDLTDDVTDSSSINRTSNNSNANCFANTKLSLQKLKPNNVAFWSKCLDDKDEGRSKTAEYEMQLKKYYAEDGSIISVEKATGSLNSIPRSSVTGSAQSIIPAGRTKVDASKMDSDAIKRSADKLIADAGYGPLISRSNSPLDTRSVRKSNSNTVVSSSGKLTVSSNGHDAKNFEKNRSTSSSIARPSTELTNCAVSGSKSVTDCVQPVALWCTANLTASTHVVDRPGSATNRSTSNGNVYSSGLPGGCETSTLRKKSPVPLKIQTSP